MYGKIESYLSQQGPNFIPLILSPSDSSSLGKRTTIPKAARVLSVYIYSTLNVLNIPTW